MLIDQEPVGRCTFDLCPKSVFVSSVERGSANKSENLLIISKYSPVSLIDYYSNKGKVNINY